MTVQIQRLKGVTKEQRLVCPECGHRFYHPVNRVQADCSRCKAMFPWKQGIKLQGQA